MTITEEMVEAAAQAICGEVCARLDTKRHWDILKPEVRGFFRDDARAALKAALGQK